jgi:triacylglycerol lipase
MSKQMFNKVFNSTCLAAAIGAAASLTSTATLAVQNGPDPTLASVKADGPYAISSQTIKGSGFASATVYSPNTPGNYALIVACPGFISPGLLIDGLAKRMATHGFVVAVVNTTTLIDFPSFRAAQVLAVVKAASALNTGPAAGKIDPTRVAVAGHSMGGGATLEVSSSTPGIVAALAWAPWDLTTSKLKTSTVPTAIITDVADFVAPAGPFGRMYYDQIPASTPKMLGDLSSLLSHFFPLVVGEPYSYTGISWMKRFADQDTRYSQLLTGKDAGWASFTSNGPF